MGEARRRRIKDKRKLIFAPLYPSQEETEFRMRLIKRAEEEVMEEFEWSEANKIADEIDREMEKYPGEEFDILIHHRDLAEKVGKLFPGSKRTKGDAKDRAEILAELKVNGLGPNQL
jgi:hypothetical protein